MKNLQGSFKGKYRICLVAVYLGKLPGWLPVWLRSCELNPQFNFILLCDRPGEVPFRPGNLRVERTALSELKDRFSTVAGFQVSLLNAYKLCDFKPAYGSAFADLLRSYDFWGHTDLDLYYGNLGAFLSEDALKKYLRLYHRGHLSLFRNVPEANQLYRLPHPAINWRTIFRSDDYMGLDETSGIEELVRFHKIPVFEDNDAIADLLPRCPDLRLARRGLDRRLQAFTFENGAAIQMFVENGEMKRREFMYVHIQKRQLPAVDARTWRSLTTWVFTPQGFVASPPVFWNESTLRSFNRPSYPHLIRHNWRGAMRRMKKLTCLVN